MTTVRPSARSKYNGQRASRQQWHLLSALPLKPRQVVAQLCGAGDGTRTRDNLLGRQGLCQLSYSRKLTYA